MTTEFKEGHIEALVRLTRNIQTLYLPYDNEESEAGLIGALSTAQALFSAGRDVRLVTLPCPKGTGKIDLADFLNGDGKLDENTQALKGLMAQSPDYVEWRIAEIEALTGRSRAIACREIAGVLKDLDAADQSYYVDLMVDKKLVGRAVMKAEIKKARSESAKAKREQRKSEAQATLPPDRKSMLLIALLYKNQGLIH